MWIASLGLLFISIICYIYARWAYPLCGNHFGLTKKAQCMDEFGAQFGVLSCLFSGFAFFILIWTIILQIYQQQDHYRELELQQIDSTFYELLKISEDAFSSLKLCCAPSVPFFCNAELKNIFKTSDPDNYYTIFAALLFASAVYREFPYKSKERFKMTDNERNALMDFIAANTSTTEHFVRRFFACVKYIYSANCPYEMKKKYLAILRDLYGPSVMVMIYWRGATVSSSSLVGAEIYQFATENGLFDEYVINFFPKAFKRELGMTI